jgi:hypothetical protein
MDPVIEKMRGILSYTKRLKEEGHLNQVSQLDLHQEMEKQNHIFNHMGRSAKNPAGRIVGLFVGFVGGSILISGSIRDTSKYSIRTYGIMLAGGVVGAAIGHAFLSRYFGDRKEVKVYHKKKLMVKEILTEFETLF